MISCGIPVLVDILAKMSLNMQVLRCFLLGYFTGLCLGIVTPLELNKEGCPKTKGCFSFPESCKNARDCDYLVTYVPDKDGVTFAMSAKNEYVALGFNDKASMSGTDSVICFKANSTREAMGHYTLVDHVKPSMTKPVPTGIVPMLAGYVDGVMNCRLYSPSKSMNYNLRDKLYLIFARGKVKDGDIVKHDWNDRSYRMYNLSIPLQVEDKESSLKRTVTVDKIGCPKTKGCVAFPESCKTSKDCDYLVTYVPDKDGVTFSMSAKSEYVALGFNDKASMSGTDSVVCYKATNKVSIGHYSLVGHNQPTETTPVPAAVQPIAAVYSSGVIKCSFKRLKVPSAHMKYDLHNKLYLIFARGRTKDNNILQHSWSDRSWRMVNVSIPLEVEGKDYVLLITHACLMFLAWIGFGTVGMFTARYMKSSWGEKRVLNDCLWFQVHRGCMLTTVLFTFISAIIIFVHVGGWSESAGWHAVIGIFIIAISIAQPSLALFRPEPQANSRFMFNWAHRFLAMCALGLALINCFLGVSLLDEIKSQGFVILSVFVVFLFLAVILYEVFLFRTTKPLLPPFTVNIDPQDNVEIEVPTPQTTDETAQTAQTKRAETIRTVVYVFIIVLASLSCLAFIIDIAVT